MADEYDADWQQRRLEEVLMSNLDPLTKVRQIVALGFSEESADYMVELYQQGRATPAYYAHDRLPAYYERLEPRDDGTESEY